VGWWEKKLIQAIGNFYYDSRPLDTHTNNTYGYLDDQSDSEVFESTPISESYNAVYI
jgi:hypothetical protein